MKMNSMKIKLEIKLKVRLKKCKNIYFLKNLAYILRIILS